MQLPESDGISQYWRGDAAAKPVLVFTDRLRMQVLQLGFMLVFPALWVVRLRAVEVP